MSLLLCLCLFGLSCACLVDGFLVLCVCLSFFCCGLMCVVCFRFSVAFAIVVCFGCAFVCMCFVLVCFSLLVDVLLRLCNALSAF